MDQLQTLTAYEEIRRLKARYCRTVDSKDWAGFMAVFTSDAIMDLTAEAADEANREVFAGMDPVLRGPEAIANFVSSTLSAGVVTVHHSFMPEIEITSEDEASGTWAMTDYLDFGGSGIRGYGHYHERYRREGGQWLISESKEIRIRVDRF